MTEDISNRVNINILKVFPSFILGKCRCKCGGDIEIRLSGYLKKFINGHSAKGENNGHWKGGIQKHGKYKLVLKKDHPNVKKDGTVYFHRLVYEEHYKCCLLKFTVIDHIDGNPSNNDISNLQPLYNSGHMRKTMTKNMNGRQCRLCKSFKTSMIKRRNKLRPGWYGNKKDGFLCISCYHKTYNNKKRKKSSLLSLDQYI